MQLYNNDITEKIFGTLENLDGFDFTIKKKIDIVFWFVCPKSKIKRECIH